MRMPTTGAIERTIIHTECINKRDAYNRIRRQERMIWEKTKKQKAIKERRKSDVWKEILVISSRILHNLIEWLNI